MNQNAFSPVGIYRYPVPRRERGETLAETLISLLVASAAMLILAGGIATGARVNKQAGTDSAVVFPLLGASSAFKKDTVTASFRLASSDTLYDPETGGEMPSSEVTVWKNLVEDKNETEQNGISWRILYVYD